MKVRITVDVELDPSNRALKAVAQTIGGPEQVVAKDLTTVLADVSYMRNVRVTCIAVEE